MSLTVIVPAADCGPLLRAVSVYVALLPAAKLPEAAFVMERSAAATIVSVSVAELLAGVASVSHAGGATVAVLAIVPEADETVPLIV